jgi:hypothetical protein
VIKRTIAGVIAAAALSAAIVSAQTGSPAPGATKPAVPQVDEKKYGVYPIAWRELITRWLETELLDAASARIEWLGEPKPIAIKGRDGQPFYGYVVDFKVNSRNKFGMYTGFQTRRVYIRNGEVAAGGRRTS